MWIYLIESLTYITRLLKAKSVFSSITYKESLKSVSLLNLVIYCNIFTFCSFEEYLLRELTSYFEDNLTSCNFRQFKCFTISKKSFYGFLLFLTDRMTIWCPMVFNNSTIEERLERPRLSKVKYFKLWHWESYYKGVFISRSFIWVESNLNLINCFYLPSASNKLYSCEILLKLMLCSSALKMLVAFFKIELLGIPLN